MNEITLKCQGCHATIALPRPDAFTTTNGGRFPSDPSRLAEEVLGVVAYMGNYGCPRCGGHAITLADAV